nr:hypothetical protein CFP56_23801 [Quercus suber]
MSHFGRTCSAGHDNDEFDGIHFTAAVCVRTRQRLAIFQLDSTSQPQPPCPRQCHRPDRLLHQRGRFDQCGKYSSLRRRHLALHGRAHGHICDVDRDRDAQASTRQLQLELRAVCGVNGACMHPVPLWGSRSVSGADCQGTDVDESMVRLADGEAPRADLTSSFPAIWVAHPCANPRQHRETPVAPDRCHHISSHCTYPSAYRTDLSPARRCPPTRCQLESDACDTLCNRLRKTSEPWTTASEMDGM